MIVDVDWYFKKSIADDIKRELVGLINTSILAIYLFGICFAIAHVSN